MKEEKFIILNSTVLYITAFLCTTVLHELAHAVAGLVNSSQPVIHHNYVEHLSKNQLSVFQQTSIALAGPVFSLLQGLLAGLIYLRSKRNNLLQLFLLWLSVLGFNNFLGYLMTGPFFNAGDIGKVYQVLEIPLYVQFIIAFLGMLTLLLIAYKLTVMFLQFSYKKVWVESEIARKNFSFRIIILPWILGSVVITILYLPVIAVISIIYPVMSGMVFIFPWQNARRIKNVELSESESVRQITFIVIHNITGHYYSV